MEISYRLRCIAAMVDKCENVIDVGTDHGYIPIFLVKNNICNKVIASDINKGPVEKARKNILLEGLSESIECRLGGGLTVVSPEEVDCAVIAGMGGNLIRDIMEGSFEVFTKLDYAIVQPVQNPEVLRKYIYNSGYTILDEELCIDEGKFYEIIKVKYDIRPKSVEDIYYEVSEVLLKKRHPLIKSYVEFKIEKYEKIFDFIADDSQGAIIRKKEIESKINKLKEISACL